MVKSLTFGYVVILCLDLLQEDLSLLSFMGRPSPCCSPPPLKPRHRDRAEHPCAASRKKQKHPFCAPDLHLSKGQEICVAIRAVAGLMDLSCPLCFLLPPRPCIGVEGVIWSWK